jgi:DNA-binding beta-propeller fold protein YncE
VAILALLLLTAARAIPLPGGEGGIGLDDLQYAPAARKVLVPAGRTGKLDLVDPAGSAIVAIGGFTQSGPAKGHGAGSTSADEGPAGIVFASDRDARRVVAVDLAKRAIVASAALGAAPDYVRWIAGVGEVWVTEPRSKTIECFLWRDGKLAPAGTVQVPDGPESLTADASRAYAHSWRGESYAIDLKTKKVTARFRNGCEAARGIAIDAPHGLLFAGCAEGKVTSVSLATLEAVGSAPAGKGVDIIAFAPGLRHLYAPGGEAATLSVIAVSESGDLRLLRTEPAAQDAHCVATDDAGNVWVCDPAHGRLLLFRDAR